MMFDQEDGQLMGGNLVRVRSPAAHRQRAFFRIETTPDWR
jgi:hypothetical protein